MDTSKKRILMCEKATEIQKSNFNDDDFYVDTDIFLGNKLFEVVEYEYDDVIWLPHQSQLQDMIAKREDVQHLLLYFYNEVGALFNEKDKYWLQFKSMEQLWLAFVMKEKYNKIWNGKEWEVSDVHK